MAYLVITGTLTVLFGILVWLLFPDSPLSAHFLTPEERAQAVLRIASNHSGIEQKRFKRYQFLEAINDPKTWLFFLHAWSQEMANGLTNQYSLIIQSFGFTTLQTTLLGCINGVTALISLGGAAIILAKTRNCRAWLSAISYVPPIVSCILLITLPWSNRSGLLTAIWIRATGGISYSVVMVWAANCSAGHTKKTAVIAMYHVGYGLGNILSPQLFQPQYKPRYVVTWSVILGVACVLPMVVVLYLRWYLVRENKRRDALAERGLVREIGIVEHVDENGVSTEEVVDARQLDLTDKENLALWVIPGPSPFFQGDTNTKAAVTFCSCLGLVCSGSTNINTNSSVPILCSGSFRGLLLLTLEPKCLFYGTPAPSISMPRSCG